MALRGHDPAPRHAHRHWHPRGSWLRAHATGIPPTRGRDGVGDRRCRTTAQYSGSVAGVMPDDARAADGGPAVPPSLTRTPPAVVTTLMACGVVAAPEVSGGGLLDPSLRPIQRGIRIVGSAVTVLCPPDDNLSIHLAVERCVPGDVLVVAVTRPSDAGVLGELLATSLRAHGVIGAVIDAGVRDIA